MSERPEALGAGSPDHRAWAPGAVEHVRAIASARAKPVQALAFGTHDAALVLLGLGASVTVVVDDPVEAQRLSEAAERGGRLGGLTVLHSAPADFTALNRLPANTRFDLLIIDGQDRRFSLAAGLNWLQPNAIVVLNEAQQHWHAKTRTTLAGYPDTTFKQPDHQTTIWQLNDRAPQSFAIKSWRTVPPEPGLKPTATVVPREIYALDRVPPDYRSHAPVPVNTAVERQLQAVGLMATHAVYLSPETYELEGAEVTLGPGRKFISYRGTVFHVGGRIVQPIDVFEMSPEVAELDGLTLDLVAHGAGRYAFFLLESLPKLQIVRFLGHDLNGFDHIAINSGAQWLTSILVNKFGISEQKLVPFTQSARVFRMERSLHIEALRGNRFTPAWIRDFIRTTFQPESLSTERLEPARPHRRVYISRQRAEGRQIVNHDDVLGMLTEYGFEEIFAEDHSPDVLAQVLSQTEILVSPHGAGLVNMVFCPPGTRVIEFFGVHFTPQYKNLADELGFRYTPICCTDRDGVTIFTRDTNNDTSKEAFNRRDLVVPMDELARALKCTVL